MSSTGNKKGILAVVVVAIVTGLVAGLLGAMLFARPGPQGLQGVQGEQGERGEQGSQGSQGTAGANGSNSVIQIIQSQNATSAEIGVYPINQWNNMSALDSSMKLTVSVKGQSRVWASFLSSVLIPSEGEVWLRIVVDNQTNSTICKVGIINVPALTITFPVQVNFLTDSLATGEHTIEVQFLRTSGAPTLLERSFHVTELVPP